MREEVRTAQQGNSRCGLARGAAIMAGLFVVAVLVEAALLHGFSIAVGNFCDREERAILEEFPQLEATDQPGRGEPVPASAVSETTKAKPSPPEGPITGCQVSYQTQHYSEEQVYEYYSEQLTAHGWTLVEPPPAIETDEPVLVLAHRGSFSYEVAAFEVYTGPDESRTHVRATVWEAS